MHPNCSSPLFCFQGDFTIIGDILSQKDKIKIMAAKKFMYLKQTDRFLFMTYLILVLFFALIFLFAHLFLTTTPEYLSLPLSLRLQDHKTVLLRAPGLQGPVSLPIRNACIFSPFILVLVLLCVAKILGMGEHNRTSSTTRQCSYKNIAV